MTTEEILIDLAPMLINWFGGGSVVVVVLAGIYLRWGKVMKVILESFQELEPQTKEDKRKTTQDGIPRQPSPFCSIQQTKCNQEVIRTQNMIQSLTKREDVRQKEIVTRLDTKEVQIALIEQSVKNIQEEAKARTKQFEKIDRTLGKLEGWIARNGNHR